MAILPLPTLKELFTGKMFGSGGADKSKPGENVHPAVILVDRLVTEANDSLQSKKIDGDKNIKDCCSAIDVMWAIITTLHRRTNLYSSP